MTTTEKDKLAETQARELEARTGRAMAKRSIRNMSTRDFVLPGRSTVWGEWPKGERLASGATIEVPGWYFEELMAERGWASRLAGGDTIGNVPRADRMAAEAAREIERSRRRAERAEEFAKDLETKLARAEAKGSSKRDLEKARDEIAKRDLEIEELRKELAAKSKA